MDNLVDKYTVFLTLPVFYNAGDLSVNRHPPVVPKRHRGMQVFDLHTPVYTFRWCRRPDSNGYAVACKGF